jgi:hypothetical protein
VLAILFTLFLGAYLFGPGLIARLILGFAVPRKTLVQSRSEEVTRSIVQAVVPFGIAVVWAQVTGALQQSGHVSDLRTVFSGVYSTPFFDAHRTEFFTSLHKFFRMNVCVLWRLYVLVIVFALALNLAIRNYSRLRAALPLGWQKSALATVVLPRVSEWHVLLSEMLLPTGDFFLDADVLTKSAVLYQGRVQDKMLGADGRLQNITLAKPRRFLREEYEQAKQDGQTVDREMFWRPIAGNLFVLMASDVVNLNLKYIRKNPIVFHASEEERVVLRRVLERLSGDDGEK